MRLLNAWSISFSLVEDELALLDLWDRICGAMTVGYVRNAFFPTTDR
jgi:hypothetical protein